MARSRRDGTDELQDKRLEEESPELKVVLACLSGGILAGGAAFVCWLTHRDPLGGASLSLASLEHGSLGLAYGIPMAVLKLVSWRQESHQSLPLLRDIHETEAGRLQPLLSGMTAEQAAVVLCAEVVSTILLLFPALHGGLQLCMQLYANRLLELGWQVPQGKDFFVALGILAALSGFSHVNDHAPSEEEFDVVYDAVSNADRYYKLVSTSVSQRQEDADRMSAAFKITAAAWMEQRTYTGIASAALAGIEVLCLGLLWNWTGDLSTTMVAALLSYGADFAGMFRYLTSPARRRN